ncbi:MAG: peptidylprolyl isomerase [Ignavibacteriales bacterium]|nr:peptidylprolyl isomerase [Ignavibacteriales bacterium]
MPMMARMRSLAPWFMLTVGGIFVLFMVLSDSKVTDFLRSSKQNVGSVDGEDITYQEYSATVDNFKKQQEQGGQTIDESQMDYFRDQVWDRLVTLKLINKKVQEFGIVVTDNEVRETLLGPNPPAQLRQQFTDSTGNFNRQLYETALRDPRNKQIVITVEEQIKEQLIQQKLQNYVSASVFVSDGEAKDQFIKQNIKMKANYVWIDLNAIPDTDVKVSDDELKKYYDEHAEDFKQVAERKIKYVLFNKLASKDDSLSIKKNLESIVTKLKNDTASFKKYVELYSERPYSKDTVQLSTLVPQVRDVLVKAKTGSVLGPYNTFEGYVVYKVIGKVKSKKEQVRASHILIKTTGNDKADLQKANDIYNQLMKGADFATVAKEKSDDGSKFQGGDLGWFGRGQMVKPFEDASFNGKIGVIQKPIKSQFGYHIIKVIDRSNEDLVLEKIVNKIQISASTSDKLYTDAQDFAFIAKKDGFESEAKLMKYSVIETPSFNEESQALPGIGVNQALVKFAFENSVGEISDVFRVQAGYVAAMVSDVIKPGLKKFDDVKAQIKNLVLKEKKLEKSLSVAKDIRLKMSDVGDASVAKSIWAAAKVDTTAEFTSVGNIPGIGREFAFSDYSLEAELNKWSQPVKGSLGSYLIKVNYRVKFDQGTFEIEKPTIKKQMLQTKKSSYFGQWVQDLKKESKIVDNRYHFYR